MRPWYKIHFSTLFVLAIVLAGLVFINIPGERTGPYAQISYRFYHGWPYHYFDRLGADYTYWSFNRNLHRRARGMRLRVVDQAKRPITAIRNPFAPDRNCINRRANWPGVARRSPLRSPAAGVTGAWAIRRLGDHARSTEVRLASQSFWRSLPWNHSQCKTDCHSTFRPFPRPEVARQSVALGFGNAQYPRKHGSGCRAD
jgi:hypothetical protein